MFGRFICMTFLKNGKCNNPNCNLKHVKDIASLDKNESAKEPEKPQQKNLANVKKSSAVSASS
jgi:hypothetical protein